MPNLTQSLPRPRPIAKSASFGTQRTDVKRKAAHCQSPGAYVTRIDLQTNLSKSFGLPYISGLHLTCSDQLSVPALNWAPRDGETSDGFNVFTTFPGTDVPEGVRDVIVSHGTYVNLIGYGEQTLVGNAVASQARVWQQAARDEWRMCVVVGVEIRHVDWVDGLTVHFACPAQGQGQGATAPPSGARHSVAWWVGAAAGTGVALAAIVRLVLTKRHRRHCRAGPRSRHYQEIGDATAEDDAAGPVVAAASRLDLGGAGACKGGAGRADAKSDPWAMPVVTGVPVIALDKGTDGRGMEWEN